MMMMPHEPCFRPGDCGTARLTSALPICGLLECLDIRTEAWLDPTVPTTDREVTVPDAGVVQRYAA